MTLHLGLAALLAATAAWSFLRAGRRGVATVALGLLATAAAVVEVGIAARESGLRTRWDALARAELTERSERIVGFLRAEGSRALGELRAIGADPDTRALLSSRGALARTARRPVFLDLNERFPGRGNAGVTIYDAEGAPRAWAGWSPPATMSLPREPSRSAEVVEIRQGNIYTLLQVTHPVVAAEPSRADTTAGETVLGYAVYHEPLRVQFPLENRFLRIEDVLQRLQGPGGVRADVALELALASGDDLGSIRTGALKLDVRDETASATAAIVTGTDDIVGRVSLTGLSRGATLDARLASARRLRAWLLLAVGLLVAVRLWFRAEPERAVPAALGRIALVVAARAALLLGGVREHLDVVGLFDSSVYALDRFGGLLRSPGDVLLTAAAFVLIAREVRRLVVGVERPLARFAHRLPLVAFVPGVVAALLVGSVAGRHWLTVVGVVRDSNAPLYGGLDPFSSVPVAALELALLFGGAAFLLFGDALVTLGAALTSRLPARLGPVLVWGLALFGCAVKVGSAADEASFGRPGPLFDSDLFRVALAMAALFAFHRLAKSWSRPGAGAVFVVAILATLTSYPPLLEASELNRRELVELFAQEHVESPSNYRHFLADNVLSSFAGSTRLRRDLESGVGPEEANLAFILWARSPLATVSAGSRVRVLDADGRPRSTFSIGFPPELERILPEGQDERGATRFRREEIGTTRVDVYSGRVPLSSGDRRLGSIELAMVYFDDLRGPGPALPSVFSNLTAPEEFRGIRRAIPERIDRYRGEALVYSTDPEGGLGRRVPPWLVEALAGSTTGGKWIPRRIGGKLYDLYCVRERDGMATVGYLTFGIERFGIRHAAGLLVRSVLVALVLAGLLIVFLMAFAWAAPPGRAGRLTIPRPGFRERVIAGFLFVSLLPTVFLGYAGRRLFVEEKRQEFQQRLEEDLRVARELIGRRLSDAVRNAAVSDEVVACFREEPEYRVLSTPRSVEGIVVMSEEGRLLGSSRSADLAMAILPGQVPVGDTAVEFFRRRGERLYSCSLVPVPADPEAGMPRGGSVLAFQPVDAVIAADLERRVGSAVSFFVGGQLTATSRPELYQSEILSDLAESGAYLKIELEGARRTVLESRVGSTSFLASYGLLPDENGEAVGMLATLAAFRGGGLDVEAALVLSRIYFVCLAVIAAAILVTLALANRLTRPISDLTAGAEAIGAGNLGHEIRSRAGGEIGALVRSFNLMSRRLAESEARDRERREYIEAIIRHVGSGVISFDASGRFATVNEAAARIVGADTETLVGRRPDEVEVPPVLGSVLRAVEPLLAGKRAEVEDDVEVEGADGEDAELRSIRLVGTPLVDRDGRPQGAVVVFEDLTDLIRSKKIKAWAQMARQVAHEIKNPLTPMKLSAQHILQAWHDKHPKFDRILEESAETIVDRCEALRRIAIEFSDYARMPGRKVRREDLGDLLREARRLYGEAGEGSVEFSLDVPEDEIVTRIDRDEVMRLFINLIENAVQAMPDGGNLRVKAWSENGSAHVTIRDSGSGITPENLERIFEPSFSTKTGGAGLGLPICRAIMEDYGGSIDIESEPGRGTLVTLEFPSEDAASA